MARNKFRRKLETYQALACINVHFEAIAQHVFDLEQMGFFRVHKMRVLAGFVRELQAHISHAVVDRMHAMEDDALLELQNVRIEWENYFDPDRAAAKAAPSETAKPARTETVNPEVRHSLRLKP